MSSENPPPKKPVEDFSFGSLREEMGDIFPTHREVEVPDTSPNGEKLSLSQQEVLREKKEAEARINAKVLGASGAVAPPMWMRGLPIAIVAVVLFFVLADFKPIGNYVTILLAAGAALWNGNGILKDEEPRDRGLAAVGAVVGVVVLALTVMRLG